MGKHKKKKIKTGSYDDKLNNEEDMHEEKTNNEEVVNSLKRKLSHEEETIEDPIKVKKKKKPLVHQADHTDTSSKKTKKSIRQMKKEKFAQRQAEADIAAKNELKSQCLSYLSQWKYDKQNWKFMKVKQVWLLKNKFSMNIPNESWQILLEYFESAKGNIRNILLEDAHKIIKQMDEWTEEQEKGNENVNEAENSNEAKKPDDIVYSRARSLIQCLEE